MEDALREMRRPTKGLFLSGLSAGPRLSFGALFTGMDEVDVEVDDGAGRRVGRRRRMRPRAPGELPAPCVRRK